jgi:NADH-quinone oxidoreductase subunit M
VPLVALIFFMGIYPKPVLDRIQPSVDRLITHVEAHSDYKPPTIGGVAAKP